MLWTHFVQEVWFRWFRCCCVFHSVLLFTCTVWLKIIVFSLYNGPSYPNLTLYYVTQLLGFSVWFMLFAFLVLILLFLRPRKFFIHRILTFSETPHLSYQIHCNSWWFSSQEALNSHKWGNNHWGCPLCTWYCGVASTSARYAKSSSSHCGNFICFGLPYQLHYPILVVNLWFSHSLMIT